MEKTVSERLAKMEGKWDGVERRMDMQERRVSNLEENNEILHKMEVLLEMQTETSKEHNKQLNSFENTLIKVNENLSNLNRTQIEMQSDISNINNRIEQVEKSQEETEDKGKIDIVDLIKKIIIGLFMIIPTIVSAWFLMKLGLK